MKNYLLDTHILIWFITNDSSLPESIKQEIRNKENNCFVSIASLWEIGIKHSIGKLDLKTSLSEIFRLVQSTSIELLPITIKHIIKNSILDLHHRDPFDRLIIAQALEEDLILVSKDEVFSKYPVPIKWL